MKRIHRALVVLTGAVLAPLALVRCANAGTAPSDLAAPEAPGARPVADVPSLSWPLAHNAGVVTAPFGSLPNPLEPGTFFRHRGIDIAWAPGTWILAAASGTVTHTESDGGYGQVVEIDHGSGYHTLYAHLEGAPVVQPGEAVQRGQHVGHLGNTGLSTGYHLHFELTCNGDPVNPLPHLEQAAGE